MNILYLSERDPRDTHFGGAQRTNLIWRSLQQCGEVYSICFDQQYKTEEIAPHIWHGKKLLRVNAIQYFLYRAERKILEPFNVLPLWPLPTRLEKGIDEIFQGVHFDVVVCRYCQDLAEMHLWNYPKILVDFDDHPLEMYDTLKSLEVKPWLRPIGRMILKMQMKYIEKRITGGWISNPNQVSFFSEDRKIVPLRNIPLSPSEEYTSKASRNSIIVSVGAMSYYPNYMGVDRFLNVIWPTIHKKYPELVYAVVGKGIPEAYMDKWQTIPNVKLLGFVEDLERIYQECLCSVVSIYAGGGTCIKTLESLSFSRVCLTTHFGARGLEQEIKDGGSGIFEYTSAESFLVQLESQVLNEDQRAANEKNARQYIEEHCSKESFSRVVIETVQS